MKFLSNIVYLELFFSKNSLFNDKNEQMIKDLMLRNKQNTKLNFQFHGDPPSTFAHSGAPELETLNTFPVVPIPNLLRVVAPEA